MATTTQSTLNLTNEIKTFYNRQLLERALPQLTHARFGQQRPLPRRSGKTMEFRKFTALAPSVTPVTEGVTPDGNNLAVTTVTASINQYGDYILGSDLLDLTAIDPVLAETAELLGEQAGLSMDRIVREILAAGTNVNYSAGRVSRPTVAAGDILTVDDVRKAVRTLKNANTRPLDGGQYVGIVSPMTTYDLQSDVKWRNPHEYSDTTNIYSGEIGSIYGVRFIETTEAKVFTAAGAASINVYATLVLGADAFGVIPLDGGDLDFIFKPVGEAGTADPLNQRWTSGWKVSFTAAILNQLAMVRIEHAATNG